MLKTKPERITYAQEKLIKLIESRKLRQWCIDNNLTHSAIYRLALNEQLPTYKIISSMCHIIAPIEWLYYTDETLPFEAQVVPQWDSTKHSKFIKEHKFDYETIAKKYNIEKLSAYNLFVSYRAKPSIQFIRSVSKDVNPIEFFIDSDTNINIIQNYIPKPGDIISYDGKLILTLSKQENNSKYTFGCLIQKNIDGILLENTITKGFVNLSYIDTFPTNKITLIESVTSEFSENIAKQIKSLM